jgi:hypothetical protein
LFVVQCAREYNIGLQSWLNCQTKSYGKLTRNDIKPHKSVTFLSWWPLLLLSILLLLRSLLPATAIEAGYSRGLFIGVREVWDFFLPRLPVPLFYLFWVAVIWWIWATARRCIKWFKAAGRWSAWGKLGRRVLNSIALLISVFLLGWGFNYGRVEVNEKIGFEMYQPTLEELRSRVYTEAAELATLRQQITSDTAALTAAALPSDLEAAVRPLLINALQKHGYPAPGRPRARQLQPKGVLLRLSTAGVYWPWAGEGNIDAGLHPLQKPAVMAHELSHAYGFGDEGTCTFWAWLAGRETSDPALAYTFKLAYWRRIAGRLRQQEPQAYWAWRAESLAPGIRNDLQAIYDNAELYKDIAPVIRDVTYDAYLKAQGIHEGLLNYGKVVRLVEGYLVDRKG